MCATSVLKVRKDLSLPPGHWQLIRYGLLGDRPTVKQAIWITAVLRKVTLLDNKQIDQWQPEVVCRQVPVGEMLAWDVGCIFNADTHIVLPPRPIAPSIRMLSVHAEFSDENCSFLPRYARGQNNEHLIPASPAIPEIEETNSYLLRVERPDDIPLVMSCATVLQFFWSRSSNLVHMLLDSRFQDFNHYVVNLAKSHMTPDGHALIWLRQWSLDADARFLASLVFGSKKAVSRAQEISLYLQQHEDGAHAQYRQRALLVKPPHPDPVDLLIEGSEFNTKSAGRFLYVQRILRSSYRPPFISLAWDRDNDGRRAAPSLQGTGDPIQRKPLNRAQTPRPRFEGSTEFKLEQDHPSTATAADTVDIGKFDAHFPDLSSIPAEKLPQEETSYESDDESIDPSTLKSWGKLSTLPGVGPFKGNGVRVTLSSGKVLSDPIDRRIDAAGPRLGELMANVVSLAPFDSSALLPEGVTYLNIQPITLWSASPAYSGTWLFTLPGDVDDFEWAWLYCDPLQNHRKRGLCLRVTYLDESDCILGIGYILEIEGRSTKPRVDSTTSRIQISPTMFVWRDANENERGSSDSFEPIDYLMLQQLVLELISQSGSSASSRADQLGIRSLIRRHSSSSADLKVLLAELYSLLRGQRETR